MIQIHTITLNPVIDLIYRVDHFEKGSTFRCDEFRLIPAGKGINVSYALSCMGETSNTYLVVGKHEVPEYERECAKHSILCHAVAGDFNTRRHCTILERIEGKVTHVQVTGAEISSSLIDRLSDEVVKHLSNKDIVILSGSLPAGIDSTNYKKMIMRFKKEGATVILDSSGEPLKEGLTAHPYLVKLNQEEAEEVTNKKITGAQDEYAVLQRIHHIYGIPFIIVSFGARGMIAGCEEGAWRMSVKIDPSSVVDTVGCGDSMVAGLAYALKQGYSTEEMFSYGIATASAATLHVGPGILKEKDVKRFMNRVESRLVGSL